MLEIILFTSRSINNNHVWTYEWCRISSQWWWDVVVINVGEGCMLFPVLLSSTVVFHCRPNTVYRHCNLCRWHSCHQNTMATWCSCLRNIPYSPWRRITFRSTPLNWTCWHILMSPTSWFPSTPPSWFPMMSHVWDNISWLMLLTGATVNMTLLHQQS